MVASALASISVVPTVYAFEINTGESDFKARWDTTAKYSTMLRLKDPDSRLTSPAVNPNNANQNDGDNNFKKGIVSNRADIFTELDVTYQNFGARVSAAAWYDTVYNKSNDSNDALTNNSSSVSYNNFTSNTQDLQGRKAELLDAFVFGKFELGGDKNASIRAGRHSVLWGETLFFGANGIAGGQAPMDYIKLLSVPSSQFKELIRPVGQVSGQFQLNSNVSFGAYYQYKWAGNRIPAVGSYLSNEDLFVTGGENFIFPWGKEAHLQDHMPSDDGQFGFQIRFRPEGYDAEYGLYAIRYHDKNPNVYINIGSNPVLGGAVAPVGYSLAYAEGIRAFGASFSTTLGDANIGGEASIRHNTPLVNPGSPNPFLTHDNSSNPGYPVGKSAHLNLSAIYLLPPSSLWQGGDLLAEVAWNRRLSVDSDPHGTLDPNSTRDAWGFRMLFQPSYYQVFAGLDLKVPIGLGYNPKGRSSVVPQFNGGVDKGGDFSIGLVGDYQKQWTLRLNYTHFLGDIGGAFDTNAHLSFQQSLKDRDFLSFSVQTTW
ncbi:DUF1302 domain-containing protein [Ferribacterium limneticum]|nr:DUF1302 domain-containing protein [Ferribacterium limneticum]